MPSNGRRGWKAAARIILLSAAVLPLVAACSSGNVGPTVKRAAFTSAEFGVAVSPRVTRDPHPPRGGGRHLVGKPYVVRGVTYTPQENPVGYFETGIASWYGADFHGRRTANGEIFSANAISAAHPTLPLPSYVRVTNPANGRSLLVRVNDRGPYMRGRIIDLSYTAAKMLDLIGHGTGEVQVAYVGPAPLNGDDTKMLMASLNRWTPVEKGNTRYAFAAPKPTAAQTVQPQDDPIGSILLRGAFSYAEAQQADAMVSSALDAATAMATRAPALEEWVAATDEDARRIDLTLGVFTSSDAAIALAERFAMLGSVDETPVEYGGRSATRLTLTMLKPGVARADVLALANELGLEGLALR